MTQKNAKQQQPEHEFFSLSISNQLASMERVDAYSMSREEWNKLAELLRNADSISGVVILATCHRVEIFGTSQHVDRACEQIMDLYAESISIDRVTLENDFMIYRGRQVVRRLMEIAGGLDSVAIGENEILGQVRRARLESLDLGTTEPLLDQLFERACITGKRIRTETNLGKGTTSLSETALQVLESQIEPSEEHHLIILGAGEFSERILRRAVSSGWMNLTVLNRCSGKARKLAEKYNAKSDALANAKETLMNSDVIITTTAAKEVLVTDEFLGKRLDIATFRPLYLVDMSTPHNIDPNMKNKDGVTLITLAELTKRVEETREVRNEETAEAMRIVDEEEDKFYRFQRMEISRQVIAGLRREMDSIRRKHVEIHARRFSPAEYEQLQKFSKSLTSALLHKLTTQLSRLNPDEDSHQDLANAAVELFDFAAESTGNGSKT